jgi:hypothetical protein
MEDGIAVEILKTVYVTKYVLTKGIQEFQNVEYLKDSDMICIKSKRGTSDQFVHKEGGHWHRTKEAAIKRAEELRLKTIAGHEESIATLRSMTFT